MDSYTFTLILESDPTEAQVEGLYGHFQGDVLSGVTSGVPYLDCTIGSATFEDALRSVLRRVREEGLVVEGVEAGRETLMQIEAA